MAAAGGVLAAAIGATIVGGAVGAGLGVLLVRAVARHHADNARSQLARGGSVIWVSTPDEAAEQRAMDLLRRCGGTSVHTHSVTREWGVANSPLHDVQPDPLLKRLNESDSAHRRNAWKPTAQISGDTAFTTPNETPDSPVRA